MGSADKNKIHVLTIHVEDDVYKDIKSEMITSFMTGGLVTDMRTLLLKRIMDAIDKNKSEIKLIRRKQEKTL